MPLEPSDQKFFAAACGYAQLEMFLDANEELEKIDPYCRAAPEILALRVAIYRGLKKWELMAAISKRLVAFQPNDVQWTVSFAYAVRRANSIEAAKEILLEAEQKFPKEAVLARKVQSCEYPICSTSIDNFGTFSAKRFNRAPSVS